MDYVEENKKVWEEHFKNVSLDFPNEEVVRFLAKCRREYPGGAMLDWGCATGRHTVLGHRFGFRMIAADYVEHCLELTRKKMEKEFGDGASDILYYVNQDIDVGQIADETLDVVLAWGIVFCNPKEKQQQMLNNIYRMLKKGGRAFCDFRTQNDSVYQEQYKDKADGDMFLLPNGAKLSILPLDELREMFAKSGFTVESLELNEFTQDNQKVHNSWWHVTLLK